jgi:hypothetical protein
MAGVGTRAAELALRLEQAQERERAVGEIELKGFARPVMGHAVSALRS